MYLQLLLVKSYPEAVAEVLCIGEDMVKARDDKMVILELLYANVSLPWQPAVSTDGDLGDAFPYNTDPTDTQRFMTIPARPPPMAPWKTF